MVRKNGNLKNIVYNYRYKKIKEDVKDVWIYASTMFMNLLASINFTPIHDKRIAFIKEPKFEYR